MISIRLEEELSRYNLDGKWNDYIGVQKEVLAVLRREGFFLENEVVNNETGMSIKINSKGIKETIGKGKRFQNLPKKLKKCKIATLRHLKHIIRNAELVADDVENYHEENGYVFAYLKTELVIGDAKFGVRITIKKKVGANWFWIHNIDENKKAPNYSTHQKDRI